MGRTRAARTAATTVAASPPGVASWATDPPLLRALVVGSAVAAVVLGVAAAAVPPPTPARVIGLVVAPAVALPLVMFSRPDRPVVGIAASILFNLEALAAGFAFEAGVAYGALLPVVGVGIAADSVRGRTLLALVVLAGLSATVAIAGAVVAGPAAGALTATAPSVLLVASFAVLAVFSMALAWRAALRRIAALTAAEQELLARRSAEDELRRTSDLLRAVVDSSPVATMAFDEAGRVRLWNRAAETILGWPADEVLARPLPRAMALPAGPAPEDSIRRALAGSVLEGDRVAARTRDGREVLLEIHAAPLRDPGGRPVGVAGQLIDVTGRVALEAELLQAQKMEAIGHLAGGMAHDFNNTLTAVGGFASLIAMEADDPEIRDHAETISASVDRARSLTGQVLAFARRSRLQPQVVDVRTVVDTLEPILRRLLGPTVDVSAVAPPRDAVVHVDPGQLEQAILNLALNARDAMPEGGRLDVTIGRAADPDVVTITVADTGTGIPAAIHDRVFEPFFTTKERGHGTGLGLAMVFGFVRQSGGTVDLRSEPGRGATFEIRLPAFEGAPGATRDENEVAIPGGAETILLVETDEAVAGFAERGLTGIGYRVLRGRDGPSALDEAHAAAGGIDLVVTDTSVRGQTGVEVVRALRTEWRDLPVVYTTGLPYPDAGVPRHEPVLHKPFTLRELSSIVRRTLDEHRTADVVAHVWTRPPAGSSVGAPDGGG